MDLLVASARSSFKVFSRSINSCHACHRLAAEHHPGAQLRRLHFHDFMLEVHSLLKQMSAESDPLLRVADHMTSRSRAAYIADIIICQTCGAHLCSSNEEELI